MEVEDVEKVVKAVTDAAEQSVVGVKEAQAETDKAVAGIGESIKTINDTMATVQDRVKALAQSKKSMAISLPGLEDDTKKFSWARALKYIETVRQTGSVEVKGCEFEKNIFDQTREKAMSQGNPVSAGYLVPVELQAEIIELYRSKVIFDKLGATFIYPKGSPWEANRKTQGSTAYWKGENVDFTESILKFGQMTMKPHLLTAFVTASRRLVDIADPSMDAIVKADMTDALAEKMNIDFFLGDGTNEAPVGVFNQPDILTYDPGSDGNPLTYAYALRMMGKVEDADGMRDNGKYAFVSKPSVFRKLKLQNVSNFSGQANDDGTPIFAPIVSDAKLAEQMGYPIHSTTAFPAENARGSATGLSYMAFADWTQVFIAQWGGMGIESTTVGGNSFQAHQVWYKAFMETDIGMRQPKSIVVSQYMTPEAAD